MAIVTKTDKLLKEVLQEVREVRALVEPISEAVRTSVKPKKISRGLRQALREVEQGKLSGPFNTVDELMAHLKRQ